MILDTDGNIENAASKPNILYVDEREDERSNFFNDAYMSEMFGEIYTLHPHEKVEDTLEEVLQHQIDAFVTDFNLSDEAKVTYNGEDLVRELLGMRRGFPCFVRTSFETDALSISGDVNRVYSKDSTTLFDRIRRQIDNYSNNIEAVKTEFYRLQEIPHQKLNAKDVDRMIELDSFIESIYGEDQKIPSHLKLNIFKINDELLTRTEALITDIKAKLEQK